MEKRASSTYTLLAIIAAVLGAALLQSSKWIMLNDSVGVTTATLLFSRYVGLACFAALALIFRNAAPKPSHVLVPANVLMALYLVLVLVGTRMEPSQLTEVISSVAGIAYGISDALFTFLFLQAFARFEPRASAVLLVGSQLLSNILMAVMSALTPTPLFVCRIAAIVLGCALVSLGVRVVASQADAEGHVSLEGILPSAPVRAPRKAEVYPDGIGAWAIFLVVGFGFCTLFGITAQISSLTGDSFALYDTATSVALVVMDALLLIYLVFRGDKVTFELAVAACGILYMFAFVSYGYFWTEGNLLAGIVLRTGYDFTVVLWKIIILRKAFAKPERVYGYVGLLWIFITVYPGRSLGLVLMNNAANQSALVTGVAQSSIMVVFVLVLAALLYPLLMRGTVGASREASAAAAGAGEGGEGADAAAEPAREPELNLDEAARAHRKARLEALGAEYGLSSREQEIFEEVLSGRTRNAIAQKMYLSPDTVKSHTSHIYMKAGVRSKQELIDKVESWLNEAH